MNPTNKFLLDKFKEHKKELIIIIAIAIFGAILGAVIPYIYGNLFDKALIQNTTLSLLMSLILIWFILSIISNYTSSKAGLMGEVIGTKISLEAEADAYAHFLTLPISFHKKEQRGEILQKISRGAWTLFRI